MKTNKIGIDLLAISLLTLATAWVTAAGADSSVPLSTRLSHLVASCAVQSHHVVKGQRILDTMVPTCSSIQADAGGFRIDLGGQNLELTGRDSVDSDGGDLMDLQVTDRSTGEVVLKKYNVLCFGDLLYGLLDSSEKISQTRDGVSAQ